MRIHNLIKEETFPNCNQVAKEFEFSWCTVMRDRLNLPMEFDSRRNGYCFNQTVSAASFNSPGSDDEPSFL